MAEKEHDPVATPQMVDWAGEYTFGPDGTKWRGGAPESTEVAEFCAACRRARDGQHNNGGGMMADDKHDPNPGALMFGLVIAVALGLPFLALSLRLCAWILGVGCP